ncbi:hypothetical protein D3C72_2214670 [compost metagenome]
MLSDTARDHGRGGNTQPRCDGLHQDQHRIIDAHDGNGLFPQTAHKEQVYNDKKGLQAELQHRWNGQQEGCPIDVAPCEVLLRSLQGNPEQLHKGFNFE